MSFVSVFCVPGNYFLPGAHCRSSGICFQRLDQRPAVFLYKQQHQSVQGWHWFAEPHRLHPGICKFTFGFCSSWKPSGKDDPRAHPADCGLGPPEPTSDFPAWLLLCLLICCLVSGLLSDWQDLRPKWKYPILTYRNFCCEEQRRKLLNKKVLIMVALCRPYVKNIVLL